MDDFAFRTKPSMMPKPSLAAHIYTFGLYTLLLVMPFSYGWPIGKPETPAVLSVFVTPFIYLADPALVIVCISGLLHFKKSLKQISLVNYALLCLLLFAGVATINSSSPSLAGYYLLRWAVGMLLFLVLSQSAPSPRSTAMVLVLGLLLQAIVGGIQYLLRGPIGLPAELAPPAEIGGAAIVETLAGRLLRAYGFTFHPNVLGGFLLIGLLFSLPLVKSWRFRITWWVILLGLILTFSRSAWLAAFLTLIPSAFWMGLRWKEYRRSFLILLAGTVALGMLCLVALAAPLRTRLLLTRMETEQASITTRLSMVEIAGDLVRQSKYLGVGPGLFSLETSRLETRLNPEPVHNVLLLLTAEGGIGAGILWVLVYVMLAYESLKKQPFSSPWPLVGLAACTALGIIGLFDFYPFGLEAGRILTFTTLGLTVHMIETDSGQSTIVSPVSENSPILSA